MRCMTLCLRRGLECSPILLPGGQGGRTDDTRARARQFIQTCTADPVRYQHLRTANSRLRAHTRLFRDHGQCARCYTGRPRSGRCARERALDLMRAIMTGLVSLQVANDPGGDRWTRLQDDALRCSPPTMRTGQLPRDNRYRVQGDTMTGRIVIVGAGPIGLATAMLLSRDGRGHWLEKDEQNPAGNGPGGVGALGEKRGRAVPPSALHAGQISSSPECRSSPRSVSRSSHRAADSSA